MPKKKVEISNKQDELNEKYKNYYNEYMNIPEVRSRIENEGKGLRLILKDTLSNISHLERNYTEKPNGKCSYMKIHFEYSHTTNFEDCDRFGNPSSEIVLLIDPEKFMKYVEQFGHTLH